MKFPRPLPIVAAAALILSAPLPRAQTAPAAAYAYEEVEVKPQPKKKLKLSFPRSTRRNGSKPEIVLRFIVRKDGSVDRLTVVRFSHVELIDPAIALYGDAKYEPGKKDGKAVDTWVEVAESYASR